MRSNFRCSVLGLLLVALSAGACRDQSAGAGANAPGTATEGMGGLAPEDFEREVQPMTSEQAQQLGIADTVPEPPPEGAPEEVPGAPEQQ
jgi:hypothetical protein